MVGETVNALVMSGGGARGAFELGVVDYLIRDKRLDFRVITGVSAGALNAAMLAQGEGYGGLVAALDELEAVYFSIQNTKDVFLKRGPAGIIDFKSDLWDLLGTIGSNSIYDFKPLSQKIQDHVNPDRLATSGKELRIGVVSLQAGEYKSVAQDSDSIRQYVLASASIPFFFPPVVIESDQYVDGGVRRVTPLKDAFEALRQVSVQENEHHIFVVLSTPLKMDPLKAGQLKNVLDILKRTTDIMVSEIYRTDLEYAEEINTWVKVVQQMDWDNAQLMSLGLEGLKDKIYAHVTVFEPAKVYIEPLEFDPQKIRAAFEAGRETAQVVMP